MNKLFVIQKNKGNYGRELEEAWKRVKGHIPSIGIKDLDVDFLIGNRIDVVVSNGLPKELYYILKGLNVVSITMDDISRYHQYADIIIDCGSGDSCRYFTGEEYSSFNRNFEIIEIIELIKKLKWDSEFFGFNIAYLSCMHLTENIYRRIERFVKEERIKLIEYLCNCHDSRSVKVAEKNGFHFADMRLTFSRELKEMEKVALPAGITFGRATKKDIPALRKISRDIYKDSRYFFDENFGKEKAQKFYQGWVEKGVLGKYDDECWCLYDGKAPFAFCTVKYYKNDGASIGLFGLDADYQGKGFGKKLLQMLFNMFLEKDVKHLSVVTQGRNYSAQILYQSAGFRTKSTQLWYHKWVRG